MQGHPLAVQGAGELAVGDTRAEGDGRRFAVEHHVRGERGERDQLLASAMSLNECRDPSARTRSAAATISCTSSTVDGRWRRSAG